VSPVAVLAVPVVTVFAVLGVLKVRAHPAMVARAEHVGFTAASYRYIGILELAGAAGVATGLAVPAIGTAAAAGLLLLLAGALTAHLRTGDGPRDAAPAVVATLVVSGYLVACLHRG
jgi:hypothetical protein